MSLSVDSTFQTVKYSGATADNFHATSQSFINQPDIATTGTIDPMLLVNNRTSHSTSPMVKHEMELPLSL